VGPPPLAGVSHLVRHSESQQRCSLLGAGIDNQQQPAAGQALGPPAAAHSHQPMHFHDGKQHSSPHAVGAPSQQSVLSDPTSDQFWTLDEGIECHSLSAPADVKTKAVRQTKPVENPSKSGVNSTAAQPSSSSAREREVISVVGSVHVHARRHAAM